MLLDVMMPKVDGYQVLQQLKADGRLHNIPVIMISALNEIDSVVRCIELGAVDYLSKPFNPVLLKARVGASLEKKRLRDEVRAHLARMEEELEVGTPTADEHGSDDVSATDRAAADRNLRHDGARTRGRRRSLRLLRDRRRDAVLS